jgi:uncharacterized membrane protein
LEFCCGDAVSESFGAVEAGIYNGLAMAVVGSLSVATLFTLVFVLLVYTLVDGTMKRLRRVLRISH